MNDGSFREQGTVQKVHICVCIVGLALSFCDATPRDELRLPGQWRRIHGVGDSRTTSEVAPGRQDALIRKIHCL